MGNALDTLAGVSTMAGLHASATVRHGLGYSRATHQNGIFHPLPDYLSYSFS
jgi:hypothetical protein